MKKQQAIKLLDETFNTNFQMDSYAKFIKELFNVVRIKLQDKTPYIANQYRDYVSKFQKISGYTDSSRKKMEILAVKLKKTSSRDRARTMQRNFIANWLGKMDIDAALVAFYGDDPEDWRFSFVKMEYNLFKDESGKVKIAKELTPAKRYSYLVGTNEPNHTCRGQFLNLVMDEDGKPTVDNIEMAFSIDNVTKEFFEKYKELVFDLKKSLEKLVKRDAIIRKEFEEKGITTIDFAKKLLGQIVFIYFLQKKGWLGVGKNKDGTFKNWGFGPKNFLRRLYNKDIVPYENFFNDILEPLFYEALSTERDDDYYSRFKCKIPFLNGGLFEPINDYDWTGTDIIIDNSAFEKILKVFDRFNFTVKEDEPLEREVAVDPEMLGKVFENLLGVKERKDKGAFYTPREIVHYMCQQSLINYLETNTDISSDEIEKFIQYGDLALDQTIRALEQKKMYFGKTYDIKEEFLIPPSIQDNYRIIDQLLRDIKIVDPAVGSGAFPIGMMNEIVKARSILTIYFGPEEQEERTEYNFKRETIENSLYGVDIEPSAVEIAKLRFWLSLIVDEGDMKNIKPLPNLDHKIMCGNSLLEEFEGIKLFDDTLLEPMDEKTPDSFKIEQIDNKIGKMYLEMANVARGVSKSRSIREIEREINKLKRKKEKLLFSKKDERINLTLEESLQRKRRESQSKLAELKKLQKKYFNEQNRKTKKQLREDIDRIEWELIKATLNEQGDDEAIDKLEQYKKTNTKPFFLWKLYFAEVFQRENPGFDVVIANPPYIQLQKAHEISESLANIGYETFTKMGDIYCIFYEKSLQLSRLKGVSVLITSNSWLRTKYGKLLRKYFINRANPLQLLDFENAQLFDSAIVETNIMIVEKAPWANCLEAVAVKKNFSEYGSLWTYVQRNKVYLSNLDENSWTIGDEESVELKKKIEMGSNLLRDLDVRINFGVKTGFNRAFIIDSGLKNNLVRKDSNNTEILKPLVRGRDVKRYSITFADKWLISTFPALNIDIDKYPIIQEYLNSFGKRIYQVGETFIDKHGKKIKTRKKTPNKWFETQDQVAYHHGFRKEKIIWGELSDRPKFAYDSEGLYPEATLFFMTGKNLKLLLAILNSKLSEWFFNQISTSSGMGTTRWKKYKIEMLPIKEGSSETQTLIISLVEHILSLTKNDDYRDYSNTLAKVKELEREIDRLVYELYELTPKEIGIIENFCEGK